MNRSLCICISMMAGIMFFGYSTGVNAEWKGKNCERELRCCDASSKYTEPYCYYTGTNQNVDYANKCNFSMLANLLSVIDEDKNKSKRDIIELYCKSVLSAGQNEGRIYYAVPEINGTEWDWAQTFDSHQSLFMYVFCASFKDETGISPFLNQSYDYKDLLQGDIATILKLRQRSKGKDLCSLKDRKDLGDCDMSIYATDIFSAIMSEIFKIKYAEAFQIDSVKNYAKKPDRIKAFLSGYFNMTDDFNVLQSAFPQTVDVIDANQKYYKQILDSLELFDNDKIVDIAKGADCNSDKKKVGAEFIACALHGSNGNGMTLEPAFITWFSNELLNYRMFMEFYQKWISLKTSVDTQIESEKRKLMTESTDLREYVDMQVDTAWQAFHDLEDVNMTYPLHIGLLLYQERIKRFRDINLSPIITHFYSLSEKLQNVQIRES